MAELREPRPDWPILGAALGLLVLVCPPLFLFPQQSEVWIQRIYFAMTHYLGVFYLWGAVGVLAFCVWIAAGRHGTVKLGKPESQPRFSTFSWGSMLFCAGVATGLLYWGTIEWAYYYDAPPFGLEPRSAEAVRWASVFGVFHWGPAGWAFYLLPALAMGHAHYVRGVPRLRLSTACGAVLGKGVDGVAGRLFDLCFVIGLLGAAGTSLGFGAPMIAAGVGRVLGIEESYSLTVAISAVCAGIFGLSVYLGLDKGIRRLSTANVTLALALLAFVAAVGPTGFLVERAADGASALASGALEMHALWGPFDEAHYGFARDWTVFYWAWWIAVGPFTGVFIAQISAGRTFRQIVVGTLTLGTLGSALFYFVLGNYALSLQLGGVQDVVAVKDEMGAPQAIVSVIASLPLADAVIPFFCLISLVFLATTYDSASYALAASASERLSEGQAPSRRYRVLWAALLALLPTALLAGDAGGGRLRSMQTASLIASAPLLLIFVVTAISLVKALREDERRT